MSRAGDADAFSRAVELREAARREHEAALSERARIVAWLHVEAERNSGAGPIDVILQSVARSIEQGAHCDE